MIKKKQMYKIRRDIVMPPPNQITKYCGLMGTAYCGSTITSYILGSSKDIMSTGEINKGRERFMCAPRWHGGGDCPFWTDDFVDKLMKDQTIMNKSLKDQSWKALGSKIVFNVDKNPEYYRRALERGDDVDCVIVLFKRPEAFAYSWLAHNKYLIEEGKRTRAELIEEAGEKYREIYSHSLEVIEKYSLPHIFISYEELTSYPKEQFTKICDFLGAEFNEDMLQYWNNGDELHMAPSGNRGAYRQFMPEDYYNKLWNSYIEGEIDDKAYNEEHANWFLQNYRTIRTDEKWKSHLDWDDISKIRSNLDAIRIYHNMIYNSELESEDYRKLSSSLVITAIDASRECSGGLGTKYLRSPQEHIKKNQDILNFISPSKGSKVFEIGPGVGFFAYFCQKIGIKYMGIDSKLDVNGKPWDENNSYNLMHRKLNLTDLILKQSIAGDSPVDFHGKHDHIVAIGASFAHGWSKENHKFFLRECYKSLLPGGTLFLQYNREIISPRATRELYYGLSDSEKMSTTRFNQNEVFYIAKDSLAEL